MKEQKLDSVMVAPSSWNTMGMTRLSRLDKVCNSRLACHRSLAAICEMWTLGRALVMYLTAKPRCAPSMGIVSCGAYRLD